MATPIANQSAAAAAVDSTSATPETLGAVWSSWNRFVEVISSNTVSLDQVFGISAEDATISKVAKLVFGLIPALVTSVFSLLIATITVPVNFIKDTVCCAKASTESDVKAEVKPA